MVLDRYHDGPPWWTPISPTWPSIMAPKSRYHVSVVEKCFEDAQLTSISQSLVPEAFYILPRSLPRVPRLAASFLPGHWCWMMDAAMGLLRAREARGNDPGRQAGIGIRGKRYRMR